MARQASACMVPKLPGGMRASVSSRPLANAPRFQTSESKLPVTAKGAKTEGSGTYSAAPPWVVPEIPKLPVGPLVGTDLVDLFKKFKKLQNGSDVRGIAIGGVPNEPVSLTPGIAHFIGYSFTKWLEARRPAGISGPVVVSVGRDPRISGPMMEAALVSGIVAAGGEVDTFGIATTPCMFYSIVESKRYEGAIMLTASHMPFNSNGLKFFTADGGLEKGDITELLQGATQACAEAGVLAGEPLSENAHLLRAALKADPSKIKFNDFLPVYSSFLRDLIKKGVNSKDSYQFPLAGLKIVVDAGNGSGGFFAHQVLAPLGADVTGSRFLDPDGSFPNHIPNPEHPSAMKSGSEAVKEVGADLGIVFDTDVDRSAVVDRSGSEISSNRFIALMSAIILREYPGSTIVTDSVTSNGLTEFITKLGGVHLRFKRGYKNVISKGVELNKSGTECHLMMETSGHGAVKENWFLDDGAFLAVQVVIEMVRRRNEGKGDIGDFLAELHEAQEAVEVRVRINSPEFKDIGGKALALFHDFVSSGKAGKAWTLEKVNYEGWRVNVDEGDGKMGWVLLRQSLHDPIIVLNAESELSGGCKAAAQKVLAFFEEHCAGLPLDKAKLEAVAN